MQAISTTKTKQEPDVSCFYLKQLSLSRDNKISPPIKLKESKINNRRYLGNKYKLIPFIKKVVKKECDNIHTVADIFSGTGAVASAFTDKKIITNDILYSNYIAHVAWFSPENYSEEKITKIINEFNGIDTEEDNYMRKNFADTFFSAKDCSKIGKIRETIEQYKIQGTINTKEHAILVTSLLYSMDKIANTVGHYDAYRKNASFDKKLELTLIVPDKKLNKDNLCYNMDANELVKSIEADLLYIDPPYNSRQYCDAYHLIENVARWEKPEVFGVARKMDRTSLKSDYCTRNATQAFEELIENANARYILLSYNNMAKKGNERSNAKIADEDIYRILRKKGKVKVFSKRYKPFTTGKSNITQNEERLFLCICNPPENKKIIVSPLNYTGGKHKLLPQLLPLFPQNLDLVVDLFCGGCNVGINIDTGSRVIFNDNNSILIGLLNAFKDLGKKQVFTSIFDIINNYDFSLTCKHGYEYYNCNSKDGLAKYNKKSFLKLRKDVNQLKNKDYEYYLKLYVLIVYSFNNQIRFNKKGQFNLPVGKRDFNNNMQNKLATFIDRINNSDYKFTSMDFREFDLSVLTKDSLVYVDPPYLITCASYNEQKGWTEQDELDLLTLLDTLNLKNIRFALSNVLVSKGKKNMILDEWIKRNNYHLHKLDFNYANSNYQRKGRNKKTQEVLVTNYRQ